MKTGRQLRPHVWHKEELEQDLLVPQAGAQEKRGMPTEKTLQLVDRSVELGTSFAEDRRWELKLSGRLEGLLGLAEGPQPSLARPSVPIVCFCETRKKAKLQSARSALVVSWRLSDKASRAKARRRRAATRCHINTHSTKCKRN